MIALRFSQIASQHAGGLNLTRAFTPRKDALAAIPELRQVWRKVNRTPGAGARHGSIRPAQALESNDTRQRLIAARLILKTKQGRKRGFRA
jgi:hypothetical protein